MLTKRKLGRLGPEVSSLGLGCMGMSEFYGEAEEAESVKVVHEALALGMNFLDTSDMYGPCTNELLLGKALTGRREQVVLATKFGIVRTPDGGFGGVNGRPEYVKACCDASLKRLKTDYIDLYYQHRVDPNVPIEETVGTMGDLVQAGKVRFIGLSEAAAPTLRRACREHPVTALQTEYSLWSRDPEDGLLATCVDLGIAFVAYSPLGRGFLSGQIRSPDDLEEGDFRLLTPRFQGENFQRNLDVVDEIRELAAQRGCTAAQLALAWVLSRGEHIVPIPGTTKVARLHENAAADRLRLTVQELEAIEAVAPRGFSAGERYDAGRMKMMNL
ncbi:MAG: aldo/keto reductase [Gammaproteobacteria bacterium]|nr:aldo/keto reductase [Gammaproteobacteria bacterium]MBI5616246.1 aldo/keto reductase [Gammaproteobacteria bacterium]